MKCTLSLYYAAQLVILLCCRAGGFSLHTSAMTGSIGAPLILTRIPYPLTTKIHDKFLLHVDLVDAYGDNSITGNHEEGGSNADLVYAYGSDDNTGSYYGSYTEDSSSYSSRSQSSQLSSPSAPRSSEFPLPRCTNIEPQQIVNWNEETSSRGSRDGEIPTTTVVLVTHCTIDRLKNLKQQMKSWNGYASIVIYISSKFFWRSRVNEIKREFESDGRVAVSIIHNTNKGAGDDPYPINYLRNAAVLQAREQYARKNMGSDSGDLSVLLVDVDFVPSQNLQTVLHAREAKAALKDEVVIIPAFEAVSMGFFLPCDMNDLLDLSALGQVEGFHMQHFPQGHEGTNFDKFWALSSQDTHDGNPSSLWNKRYKVEHSEGFEPYIVISANKVPLYDERFQGYGLNKISHLASVAATVTSTFTVLPGVFLVAAKHKRSKEWERIYGNSNSTEESDKLKSNLRELYNDFRERLVDGEAPFVSEVTSCRLKSLNDD